ncbi:MAG: hypothetical protein ACKVHO_10170 [Verrucomicrobiia bacterium]
MNRKTEFMGATAKLPQCALGVAAEDSQIRQEQVADLQVHRVVEQLLRIPTESTNRVIVEPKVQ